MYRRQVFVQMLPSEGGSQAPAAPRGAARHRPRRSSIGCFPLRLSLLSLPVLIILFQNFRYMERKLLLKTPRDAPHNKGTDDEDECRPRHDWQLPRNSPMSCNLLHEMETSELEFINCGGDRCAFKAADALGLDIVIKTPK